MTVERRGTFLSLALGPLLVATSTWLTPAMLQAGSVPDDLSLLVVALAPYAVGGFVLTMIWRGAFMPLALSVFGTWTLLTLASAAWQAWALGLILASIGFVATTIGGALAVLVRRMRGT